MMNSNLEQIQERQRVRARIVSLATVVCLTAAMFTVTAFAANTETAQGFQQITSAGKTILLQAITAPLALVGIGFNVVKALLGTEKGMEKCKDNIIKILFVVGVIFLAPLFVTTVTGAIGNIADNSTNQIFG